ncbi:unnamed protein product [Brachionus calyciflorus]|uniref:Tetratricopeptide repeat protein 30 n=1 Tax=Brachionus calyciflorus TaxID=104777 RepID=A0A813TZK8_9BILA|nr:unnamed protein product [Brachionus calyciflorus]
MSLRYDLRPGEATSKIYTLIKNAKYKDAIDILNYQLQINQKSRAGLSLLAFCYYSIQDYVNASDCYEQLSNMYPDQEQYKLYYAQSLYKCGLNAEAMKICAQIETPSYQLKVLQLQAAIKYAEDDIKACMNYIERSPTDDVSSEINKACILFKEDKVEEALENFKRAKKIIGSRQDISYNIAVCYYRLKQYDISLKHIADIIEKGITEHPELSVGMQTDGVEVSSVGNTLVLHESCLVEAFNLKAAIHFNLKNLNNAREALTDMPPRTEAELDPITLHNLAIMNMDEEPSSGFEKLQFLIQQNSFPFETFANLCFLYVKYGFYSLVADVLAENSHLTMKHLTQYEYDFLEAKIMQQTSPEQAYRKLEEMTLRQVERLRKLTKEVADVRKSQKEDSIKRAVQEYDENLEKYIPVLMAQASIYWDMQNYAAIEKLFKKSYDFCSEHDIWRLNAGHVLFMQEHSKYKKAIDFYEPIVKNHYENILSISPVVLANLCVTYVMSSLNEEAEDLMRKIEREEDKALAENPDRKYFHLCIVNLVIGTLYCAKGNYEFGISRIMKSLEPYQKKLGTDTWFYTKRCFLSLFENMAKQNVILKDQTTVEIIQFLTHCEIYGKNIKANVEMPMKDEVIHPGRNTVAYEARYLKWLFFEIINY